MSNKGKKKGEIFRSFPLVNLMNIKGVQLIC